MSNLVPDGWSKQSISKFITKVIDNRGKTPPLSETGYELIEIASLSSEDRFPNYSKIRKFVDKEVYDTWFRAGHPKKGDILIPTVGTIGICCILGASRGSIAQNLIGLRVCSENDPVYTYYVLSSYWTVKQIEMVVMNAVQPSLKVPQFMELEALQPPLPEQKKIAKILTSVDEVIEKTQAQIDKLTDLKTGMMQELLTNGIGHTEFKDSPVGRIPADWSVKELGDVFTLKNGVNKGKEAFGTGVPIISYRNVFDGGGISDNQITGLVDLTENELSRFKVDYGDIFITRTSETPDEIGFVNVYLGNRNNVVYNGFVIRGRQNEKLLLPEYCKYAFQSYAMRNQMIVNSKFTTRAGISGETLVRLKLPIPSLNEQRKIAESVGSIDNKISALSESLNSKTDIKKALLQDLLTGKIRVKV